MVREIVGSVTVGWRRWVRSFVEYVPRRSERVQFETGAIRLAGESLRKTGRPTIFLTIIARFVGPPSQARSPSVSSVDSDPTKLLTMRSQERNSAPATILLTIAAAKSGSAWVLPN
jgi:hypothetical protein